MRAPVPTAGLAIQLSPFSSLKEPVAILHLLSHLYVQRSLPVWKDHAEWFNETVTTHFSKKPLLSSLPVTDERKTFLELFGHKNLQYAAYRHVMVLEYRNLFRYIPREILARKSLDCDPLPPPTAVTDYDETFFEGVDIDMHEPLTRRQRQAQERRLAQIIPDANTRAQIEVRITFMSMCYIIFIPWTTPGSNGCTPSRCNVSGWCHAVPSGIPGSPSGYAG